MPRALLLLAQGLKPLFGLLGEIRKVVMRHETCASPAATLGSCLTLIAWVGFDAVVVTAAHSPCRRALSGKAWHVRYEITGGELSDYSRCARRAISPRQYEVENCRDWSYPGEIKSSPHDRSGRGCQTRDKSGDESNGQEYRSLLPGVGWARPRQRWRSTNLKHKHCVPYRCLRSESSKPVWRPGMSSRMPQVARARRGFGNRGSGDSR